MSTSKHKAYRKILNISKSLYNGIPYKTVIWALIDSQTKTTIRTTHIGISTYFDGKLSNWGISAYMSRKSISISKKSPEKSLSKLNLKHQLRESATAAYAAYCENMGPVSGIVVYFDKNSGEGMVKCDVTSQLLPLYACNIEGARTGYPQTACAYVEKGARITFTHHSACGAVDIKGGLFDTEKWQSLDQSKLAFLKSEDGTLLRGLF